MNNAEEPSGLSEKDFDAVFTETRRERPGASTEEIAVLVNAKMQIRKGMMESEQRRQADRKEAMQIPLSDELYQGWKAFSLQEGHSKGLERADFDANMKYLRAHRPETFLWYHPFWMQARTDPAAAVARAKMERDVIEKRTRQALKEAMEGEMGNQMRRFVDVMSKKQTS